MKTIINNAIFSSIFRKSVAIGFLTAFMAMASYAQQVSLYPVTAPNTYFGRFYFYDNNTRARIELDGNTTRLEIYGPCKTDATSNLCPFQQFNGAGVVTDSGEIWWNTSSKVHIRWLYYYTAGKATSHSHHNWHEYQGR